jgi:hypothetical protein
MPRAKNTNSAVDEIGRPTSAKAQRLHDEKGNHPDNLANNKKVAERAAKYVGNLIGRLQMSRAPLEDKLTVLYTLWNGDTVADYFPTARSVHVPEHYKAVEGFVPRAANLLVEQPGWFRVVGMDDSGKKNAEIVKKLLLAQLKRDGFFTKFRRFLRDCAIYGYSPGKVRWKRRRRNIKYNEVIQKPAEEGGEPASPETASGEKVTIKRGKEVEVNEDGPTLEHCDTYDFFVDLRFHDMQESPGIVFRQQRFEQELLDMKEAGVYANVDQLISTKFSGPEPNQVQGPPGTLTNPATYQDIRNGSDGISIDIYQQKDAYRLYEIYEFWGRFDKDYVAETGQKGKEKEYVITLGRKVPDSTQKGGWIPLRISENPYWHGRRPAVCCHYTRRSHCFQSVGLIEPIVKLCAELDDSRNMALAARSLEAKPIFYATDEADIYSNNLILDAGTIIRTRNKDAIGAIHVPKTSDSGWRAEEMIKADIRETTGVVSTLQGTSDAASETATSIVNRTREANKRIAEVAKNIAEDFLVPMLEMFHSMNQQMMTKERMVELVGEDGLTVDIRKVSPAEVAGRVNFEITALPEIEIAGLKARMVDQFLDRAVNIMQVDPTAVRPKELLKMSWIQQFGTAELDRVFPGAEAPLKPRSAMDEHYMFGMGYDPDVQEGENYFQHFQSHTGFTTTAAFQKWNEDAKRRLLAHIMTTKARLQAEMEQMGPRLPMQPPMPGQDPNQPQQPGQPSPGQPPGPPTPGTPSPSPQQGLGPTTTTGQVRSSAASNAPRTPKEGEL